MEYVNELVQISTYRSIVINANLCWPSYAPFDTGGMAMKVAQLRRQYVSHKQGLQNSIDIPVSWDDYTPELAVDVRFQPSLLSGLHERVCNDDKLRAKLQVNASNYGAILCTEAESEQGQRMRVIGAVHDQTFLEELLQPSSRHLGRSFVISMPSELQDWFEFCYESLAELKQPPKIVSF